MTLDQFISTDRTRREYAMEMRQQLNPYHHPSHETVEQFYQNIPEQARTGFVQSELRRLNLHENDPKTKINPLHEFDQPYSAQRAVLPGRPYPLTLLPYRTKDPEGPHKSLLLNWTQSYRVNLDGSRFTILDIYYGHKDLIPSKGKYIGHHGIQHSLIGLTNEENERTPVETALYIIKPIGRTGYYAVSNRNFAEERPLPHGCYFQRYVTGPTTQGSILRAAGYLAKLTNHTDQATIQTLYRRLFVHALHALAATTVFNSNQLSIDTLRLINIRSQPNLDTNPNYHQQLLSFANPLKRREFLSHTTPKFGISRSLPLFTIKLLPNLLQPFASHSLIVSIQSNEKNSASEHAKDLRQAVKALLTE